MKQTFKNYLIEGKTVDFTNKAKWVAAMKEAGADEFLNEKEFNTTLIYAVGDKGTSLKGTWNPNKDTGIMYQGPKGVGMKFYKGYGKTKRTFTKANLNN
jgi:hypothetical protein